MKDTCKTELCPYCGGELKEGFIHGDSNRAVFWLPLGVKAERLMIYSKKAIERCGGFTIDTTKFCLFANKKPVSYYCARCELLITPLSEQRQ